MASSPEQLMWRSLIESLAGTAVVKVEWSEREDADENEISGQGL